MKFVILFIKALITIPVIVYLFFLTLSNREESLDLTWSPLNDSVSLSLPLILFFGLVAGFLWGSLIMWSNTLYLRSEKREMKKRIATLEMQLNAQQRESERLAKAPIMQTVQVAPRIAAPEVV